MEKIKVEAIYSPIRKHMPWLMWVAIIGMLISGIADGIGVDDDIVWLFGVIGFIGSVCGAVVNIGLLYAILKTVGQKLLSIPLYIVTAAIVCVVELLATTIATDMDDDIVGLIAIIAIMALILYIVLQAIMYGRLKKRFLGALRRIGALGMRVFWCTLALFLVETISLLATGKSKGGILVIVLAILTYQYMRAISQVMAQSDNNDNPDTISDSQELEQPVTNTSSNASEVDEPATHLHFRKPKCKTRKKLWYITGAIVIIIGIIIGFSIDWGSNRYGDRTSQEYAMEYGGLSLLEEKIDTDLRTRLKHDYNCYRGIVRFCDHMSEIIDKAYAGESLFDWSQLPEDEQLVSSDNPDTTTYKRLRHINYKTYKDLKKYFDSKNNVSPLFSLLPDFCAVSDGEPFESDAGFTEAEYGNMIVLHFLDKAYDFEWLSCFAMNMLGDYLEAIEITYFKEKHNNVYEVEFSTSPDARYVMDYSGEKVKIECR